MVEPLAARLRPKTLAEFVGQTHLLGEKSPFRQSIEQGKLHSMILWGPPGVGKTTLGHLIANYCHAEFIPMSAVLAGVKDIREAIAHAKEINQQKQRATLLFIDEIHRFNKAQQDALLPFVEDGTVFLIGATTENPSFEVIKALLSRCRVYVLKPLSLTELKTVFNNAIIAAQLNLSFEPQSIDRIVVSADGDARRLLNILEMIVASVPADKPVSLAAVEAILQQDLRRFDKHGDVFYEQISALHKAVRGSSPDGALYWLCRMLDGGCDPHYIARRVLRMASEDIGNAEPRALGMAVEAWNALERLGQAEGELALAQVVVYLACAPKSNAVYNAFNQAKVDVQSLPSYAVPVHLRNAPTGLMKKMGYGSAYRSDHNEPDAFARGQTYFPEEMGEKHYYSPVSRGLEIKIAEKLATLREKK